MSNNMARPPLGSVSTNIAFPHPPHPNSLSLPLTANTSVSPSNLSHSQPPSIQSKRLYPIFLRRSTCSPDSLDAKSPSHPTAPRVGNALVGVQSQVQTRRVPGLASGLGEQSDFEYGEAPHSELSRKRARRDDVGNNMQSDSSSSSLDFQSSMAHLQQESNPTVLVRTEEIITHFSNDIQLDDDGNTTSHSSSPASPTSTSDEISPITVTLPSSTSHGRHVRIASIPDYFPVTASSRCDFSTSGKRAKDEAAAAAAASRVAEEAKTAHEVDVEEKIVPKVWRRGRRRFGMGGPGGFGDLTKQHLSRVNGHIPDPISTYVTRLIPSPTQPPSKILLPSFPSSNPGYREREFNPALAVAFSSSAKLYTSSQAIEMGVRRLVAIGGEEGGIRILDVDKGLGPHPEAEGWWWKAHNNGVFDFQWANNDTQILSASGDQCLRLHDLSAESPKLIATLRGHTSTIKTAVFLDTSRTSNFGSTSSHHSKVIASGGRDGNINIYDLRCKGSYYEDMEDNGFTRSAGTTVRRSTRSRSAAASRRGWEIVEDCFGVNPVLTLRQPHNSTSTRRYHSDMRSVSRSITSLVALQSMPGILASGGSFDGVVKLWDIRSCGASNSRSTSTPIGALADPTILSSNPSSRPRSINALVEQPKNGDLYALCGDSKVHVLRPSAATSEPAPIKSSSVVTNWGSSSSSSSSASLDCILPRTFVHPNLLTRSFYIRMAISPDGRHLASGSCHGGVMVWDTMAKGDEKNQVEASRLEVPNPWGGVGSGGYSYLSQQHQQQQHSTEVIAVDWGKDMLAASSDDLTTRIWRPNSIAAQWLKDDPIAAHSEWAGLIRDVNNSKW